MAHLARSGVECPAPVPDRSGSLFGTLNGKPASLVKRVDGAPVVAPSAAHCSAVGAALGRLHVASATYRARSPTGAARPGGGRRRAPSGRSSTRNRMNCWRPSSGS